MVVGQWSVVRQWILVGTWWVVLPMPLYIEEDGDLGSAIPNRSSSVVVELS